MIEHDFDLKTWLFSVTYDSSQVDAAAIKRTVEAAGHFTVVNWVRVDWTHNKHEDQE
jgi:copper chaperone CopZ